MFYGLVPLGVIHTALSLIALGAAIVSFLRAGKISLRDGAGKLYAFTTALTCATALGIYRHGGFGPGHVLAVLTLAALGMAWVAEFNRLFGPASRYVATLALSLTVLFHLIPAATEVATRLPYGHPLVSSPEAPGLKAVLGIFFVLFVIGAAVQFTRLRRAAS